MSRRLSRSVKSDSPFSLTGPRNPRPLVGRPSLLDPTGFQLRPSLTYSFHSLSFSILLPRVSYLELRQINRLVVVSSRRPSSPQLLSLRSLVDRYKSSRLEIYVRSSSVVPPSSSLRISLISYLYLSTPSLVAHRLLDVIDSHSSCRAFWGRYPPWDPASEEAHPKRRTLVVSGSSSTTLCATSDTLFRVTSLQSLSVYMLLRCSRRPSSIIPSIYINGSVLQGGNSLSADPFFTFGRMTSPRVSILLFLLLVFLGPSHLSLL